VTPVKLCTMTTALDQMPALLSGRQAGLKELVLVNLGLDVGDLGIELRVEQDGAGLDVAVHDIAVPDVADDVHLRRELALQLLVQIPCSTEAHRRRARATRRPCRSSGAGKR
jgi:hypothetical protein